MPWLARAALGSAFLLYGGAKLGDLEAFVDGALEWRVGPSRVVRPFATLLPFIEFGLGTALVLRIAPHLAAIGALALLVLFASAVVANLARGRRVPCFCAGAGSGERIGLATLARIAVLASLAVALLGAPTAATSTLLPPGGPQGALAVASVLLVLAAVSALGPLELALREVLAARRGRRAKEAAEREAAESARALRGMVTGLPLSANHATARTGRRA